MIIRLVKNKITEQRGVSIVMALFALIFITVIATLVLNSAYSNIGRVRRNQQAEQNYLTTASAAELIKKYFKGNQSLEISYSKTLDEDDNVISTTGPDFKDSYSGKTAAEFKNPFKEALLAWFNDNAVDGIGSAMDEYYYLELEGGDLLSGNVKVNDVIVHAAMEGKNFEEMEEGRDSSYLILSFSLYDPKNRKKDFQNYRMNMSVKFNCTYESETTVSDPDPVTGETTETTKVDYTFKFEQISETSRK